MVRMRFPSPKSRAAALNRPGARRRWRSSVAGLVALVTLIMALTGCGTNAASSTDAQGGLESGSAAGGQAGGALHVVAAENFWGSIASQLGGDHVQVTSVISSPDADPHDYEPTPTDARLFADSRYVILNGTGYDSWGQKLLDANPVNGRTTLTVANLLGKKAGDNSHFWYDPDAVIQVVDQITADLKRLDPANAAYYDQESIFVYLADALGLNLTTPPGFMKAISGGQEPTATEKATFDQQITQKQVKVFVYNKQNATPDVDALKKKAETAGIPVVAITETPDPGTTSFQTWQEAQLQALRQALARANGH
jgi:zinc/manganese transport system substrate-binding protein